MTDTLLRDLINLPEEVHRGQFVISLEDGVARAEQTLREYVVTDEIEGCFDEAIALIGSAIEQRASRGAYLHGSFGSGKSHFMAVLHLLLQGNPLARSKKKLDGVAARADARLGGRKFLLVPYHMIGAASMESAVLGGYVDHVRELHPGEPLPAVYLADGIIEDARRLRERMGDEAFFGGLAGEGSGGGWGALAGAWDATAFDTAMGAAPGSAERDRLVSALVSAYFSHVPGGTKASGEGFVPFDEGLSAISRHAKALGYDAVILFLDELILWLASRMADQAFVTREGPKVAKLVEAASPDRPAPIVSFIARQRDLRDLVGEHVPGADQLNFSEILKWWEGRFDTIRLEDRNLPAVVEQRLLEPKSDIAREQLDRAFEATTGRAGERVVDTLLTGDADRAAFRRVYPFSPALVSALVDLSSALQRERTALRVMAELLAKQRDELKVGDLVAIGDMYDVIAEGNEPFTEQMKAPWAAADRLYRTKFRPLLLAAHNLPAETTDVPSTHPFRADDRLVKTLLLAALVPGSTALGALTVSRLAALNHGSIRTPIPGEERSVVLKKLRDWAGDVPGLKLDGDPTDPVVSIQLSGVDTASIIERARIVDDASGGARRRKLRDLLFEALGVEDNGGLLPPTHAWIWRGTKRTVDVVFGNLVDRTDIPDASLEAGQRPKVVIDFPFDPRGRTPRDDLARLEEYLADHPPTRTLCWLPNFLTQRSLSDLGDLVVLDHLLTGENFNQNASHLSPVDRASARSLLDNQARMLRERLLGVLHQAYAVDEPQAVAVEVTLGPEDQFRSLDPTFTARPPVATTLGEAFEKILNQQFAHYWPAHPDFGDEVRPPELRTTLAVIERAARDRADRVDVEQPQRKPLRRVANPLRLGTMHEAHFVPERHWQDHFAQREAAERPPALTVGLLRSWIDVPAPMGLPREISDLIICAFAAQTDRVLLHLGAPQRPEIGRLDDAWELHTQQLPADDAWRAAVARAAEIFGLVASPLVSAAGVAKLVAELRAKAVEHRAAAADLDGELRARLASLGLPTDGDRARTATAGRALLDDLATAPESDVVSTLANAIVPTSGPAMAASIARAREVADALRATNWQLVAAATGLTDHRGPQADALTSKLRDALAFDEHAVRLADTLEQVESMATQLVTQTPAGDEPAPRPPDDPAVTVVDQGDQRGLDREHALEVLESLRARIRADTLLDVTWRVTSTADGDDPDDDEASLE